MQEITVEKMQKKKILEAEERELETPLVYSTFPLVFIATTGDSSVDIDPYACQVIETLIYNYCSFYWKGHLIYVNFCFLQHYLHLFSTAGEYFLYVENGAD